jgi:hypothetical protein
MEPEGSLPHSQAPANCPYPEPALKIKIPSKKISAGSVARRDLIQA